MKYLILSAFLLLTGCEEAERQREYNKTIHSTFIGEVEGCKLFKITGNVNHDVYLSKCDTPSSTNQNYSTGSAKARRSVDIDVISNMEKG
jgi:hypothetical protein